MRPVSEAGLLLPSEAEDLSMRPLLVSPVMAAPVLTAGKQGRRAHLLGVPVYWHFLSLDAPTVAVLWAWSFAHAARIHPAPSALAVIAIGTWFIYVADRLLDSRPGASRPDLRERHFFHARHRRPLLLAAGAAAIPLLWLIRVMPPAARFEDTVLFAISMLYFAVVHLPGLRIGAWFPRELAVGVVFACATCIPAWSRDPSARSALVLPVLLFAALCCLNCVAIETWEQSSRSVRHFPVAAIASCVAVTAVALLLTADRRSPGELRLTAAAFVSAILLLTLDYLHRRSTRRSAAPEDTARFLLALRIAADAVLLTPLVFLLPWRG